MCEEQRVVKAEAGGVVRDSDTKRRARRRPLFDPVVAAEMAIVRRAARRSAGKRRE